VVVVPSLPNHSLISLPEPSHLLATSVPPNRLLASLPAADFEMIRPGLQPFELVYETVLVSAGHKLTHVYFPHSGVISLVVSLADGAMVEAAMIGRDSVFGGSAALDGLTSLTDAIVQQPGTASILDVAYLRSAAERSITFRTTLMRHEQVLFAQAQQSAACNAAHQVESRMARWLLRMRDLCGADTFPLTQEFLAQMLGTRRNSVSLAANALQDSGLIKYHHGHMEITDLEGLMGCSCECYASVKEHYNRLMLDD
jgi:CRP-like cAMP-binding protein